MRALVYTIISFCLLVYCSTASTQSYLKYDIPLAPESSFYQQELQCLASTLYFESRGLNDRSMALVGVTTLNRASSSSGASTICGTVHKKRSVTSCDYSWYCDGKSDTMKNLTQKDRAYRIAQDTLSGKYHSLTKATHFLHKSVVKQNSGWLKNMKFVGCDKAHCFYMNKG